MATTSDEMRIVLQVGTELRITNEGEVILSHPGLELARQELAADAVPLYRFDPAGEHTIRLLDPLADRKHTKVQPLGRVGQISYGNDSSRRRILQTAPLGR
jgi:hypothetical protein